MTMARAMSELSRSSTSIEMWGCAARKAAERLRQIFRKPRGVGEEADGGLRAAGKGRQIAAHRLDIVEHDPGMIEQAFTGRRQLDAAPAARQQRNTERASSPLIRSLRRGQRQMNPCRAVGDAAGLGHRDEELEGRPDRNAWTGRCSPQPSVLTKRLSPQPPDCADNHVRSMWAA